MCIDKTQMKGSFSRNIDMSSSFDFMVCKNLYFQKNDKKLPDFLYEIRTIAYIRNLRHSSLQNNLKNMQRTFQINNLNSNWDIDVQENKSKKKVYSIHNFYYFLPIIMTRASLKRGKNDPCIMHNILIDYQNWVFMTINAPSVWIPPVYL